MTTIRQVYLYEDRNLPKCGWFHGCVMCSTITSKIQEYELKNAYPNTKNYEFYAFLCPQCQKLIKADINELENYKKIVNELIFYQLYS
jgi:hypothetical protein